MPKLPNPFGGAKKVPAFKVAPETQENKKIRAESGSATAAILAKKPKVSGVPGPAPGPRALKSGMIGQQYEGEKLKDYSAMKPKLATKDKFLNPVKRAVGLPGKPAKMVPKK